MSEQDTKQLAALVARALDLPLPGVTAVIALFDEGATVPFIARYRKEATGGLDEVQIRDIEEKRRYLKELADRREAVLASIEEQGKLTDALRKRIMACETKTSLEDLYAPYKKKRKTRGMIAKERGLEPLAERILNQSMEGTPDTFAEQFVDADKEVPDVQAALAGARDIVAEAIADNAEVRALVRDVFAKRGEVSTKVAKGKENERTKFEDYYEYSEPVRDIPTHRFMAIRRGEAEGVLRVTVAVDPEIVTPSIAATVGLDPASPYAEALREGVAQAYRRHLSFSVETDVRVDLKMRADREAVTVFADNLRHLLLAAPYGRRAVVGIDPGLRTGCKLAAVDATGRYGGTETIYPFRGSGDVERAQQTLLRFLDAHRPAAVAVGNGTAGRETDRFVRDTLKLLPAEVERPMVVLVSESGASVYSASDVAREEFPELDLTIRGAISIARRLQDPLAELVKIDPKSIGVGQYQHDIMPGMLRRKLAEVVESCVNGVGVELNTASAPLLAHVSGIGGSLAKRIVAHRDTHGPFASRAQLMNVSGLGPRAFEQAAGFLRIRDAEHPLDASAVHPERYPLVERMAADVSLPLGELVGQGTGASKIDVRRYVGEGVGEPTLRDIINELGRPGRDPRDKFEAPNFRDDVTSLKDLEPGMKLEGVVTNVTHFGAFVDLGVKQDGLVHISQLADHFVNDARDEVKVGQRVKVTVMEVDQERGRISLSAKSAPEIGPTGKQDGGGTNGRGGARPGGRGGRGGKGQKSGRGKKREAEKFSHNPFAGLKL